VQLPEIVVPLATYTGWNLRSPGIGAPKQRVPFEGSYFPFPRTKAERMASGDPRLSVAERYTGKSDYARRYAAAVDKLISERWILPEDRESLMHRADAEWELATAKAQ
jgi:hypothetical protein